MKKYTKDEANSEINVFFRDLKNKSQKDVKKIKRLAMRHNIKLGNKRKKFCKKCLHVFSSEDKIRVNKGLKQRICSRCGQIARWKIKKN